MSGTFDSKIEQKTNLAKPAAVKMRYSMEYAEETETLADYIARTVKEREQNIMDYTKFNTHDYRGTDAIYDSEHQVAVFFDVVDVKQTAEQSEPYPGGLYSTVTGTKYSVDIRRTPYRSNVHKAIMDILMGNTVQSDTFEIKDVIFHDPATIVLWKDGTKTVVKCDKEHDIYDPEKGLAMCFAKKMLGNKWEYYNTFLKYLKKVPQLKNETPAADSE